MRRQRRATKVVALITGCALLAAACGGDDDDDDTTGGEGEGEASTEFQQGGEFVDLGTFVGDPPEHIDPALNSTLDAYQVINSLYDGLTEIDASDPENLEARPLVAESYEANEDATVWTFQIREGLKFSDGTDVLPSSFKLAWERAARLGGDYSYLIPAFIDGGTEMVDEGTADELSGVVADDEAMTLEVTMEAPYANFDFVAGFQIFQPMPEAVTELADQAQWENEVMVGNGPFMMETARTDEQIVLVPNPEWDGTAYADWELPEQPYLERLTFVTQEDPETSYNAFEAGEGHNANIPPDRATDAEADYPNTLGVNILGSYHFVFAMEEGDQYPGEENALFRQAVSQAINRDQINDSVYNGTRTVSTGVTPDGIPGFGEDLCEFCAYDADAAEQALADWEAGGNEQTEPLQVQFNADAGHEDVVNIIVENLAEIGIEAEATPMETETYFSDLADGDCVGLCRAGWYADYPVYDNFMYDLFHSSAIGNNLGYYSNPDFDALVEEAKQDTDPESQAETFQEAEQILLNDDIGVIPLNWYLGDYVYSEEVANFPQSSFGLISYEQVAMENP